MIDKRKLQQAKDLQEFSSLEKGMLMSWREYDRHLDCLRMCIKDTRASEDEEEHKFYNDMKKQLKYDMNEQLKWLDSKERYQMMENLAQSDFVKSIFKMKRGDN